jgi:hypothetical protein
MTMNEREFLSYMRVVATTNADDPDSHRAHDYAHRLVKKHTASLARAEVLEVAFDNSHQLNEQLGNENRALLARAEAAEAERDELRDANDVLSDALKDTRQVLEEVTARVAELEAALAAQQWRPVTITEPSPDFTVELIVVGYRGHDGYWHYPDGPEGLVIRGWRPVPPSVALREPTP